MNAVKRGTGSLAELPGEGFQMLERGPSTDISFDPCLRLRLHYIVAGFVFSKLTVVILVGWSIFFEIGLELGSQSYLP